MTNTEHYQSLIDRLEAGSGEDRELDWDIWLALAAPALPDGQGYKPNILCNTIAVTFMDARGYKNQRPYGYGIPYYTTSLDAVLALMKEVLPGWAWQLYSHDNVSIGHVWDGASRVFAGPEHVSPCHVVLLIAILRAKMIEEAVGAGACAT